MLASGALAPDFRASGSDGAEVSLGTFRGHPLVLFFYPRAGTPGCTREVEGFAGAFDRLHERGIAVVGVSVDPVDGQRRFAERCHAPFPLVSDTEGSVARSYGVLGLLGLARRVTFLIDANGRILEVVRSPLPGVHLRRTMAQFVPQRPGPSTAGGAPPQSRGLVP